MGMTMIMIVVMPMVLAALATTGQQADGEEGADGEKRQGLPQAGG